MTRAELLRRFEESPRWVEARAMLTDPETTVFADDGGGVARADGSLLLAVLGAPADETLRAATRGLGAGWMALAAAEARDRFARLVRWPSERALIATLPASAPPGEATAPVRALSAGEILSQALAPAPLRAELLAALRRTPVFGAITEAGPVSFAYAHWESDRYFDISVDTLDGFRRRGLAQAAVRALLAHHRPRGMAPVWGAVESNAASLALARSLGFEVVDELWVFTGPG